MGDIKNFFNSFALIAILSLGVFSVASAQEEIDVQKEFENIKNMSAEEIIVLIGEDEYGGEEVSANEGEVSDAGVKEIALSEEYEGDNLPEPTLENSIEEVQGAEDDISKEKISEKIEDSSKLKRNNLLALVVIFVGIPLVLILFFVAKKISNLKNIFVFFALTFYLLSMAGSVNAYWQCNPPADDRLFVQGRSLISEIIRGRNAGAPPQNGWGNNCGIDCDNPAGCGACECRCQGRDLYCADVYRMPNSGVLVSQTCNYEKNASMCMPVAHITSPSNNNIFYTGQAISLAGWAEDGNEERPENIVSYRWVIRTHANQSAKDYSSDIVKYTRNSSISNLSPDNYYVYYNAKNKQGAWGWWKRVSISVRTNAKCGTRSDNYSSTVAPPYPSSTTTWPSGSSWCSPTSLSAINLPATPPTQQNNPVSWTCLGENGGSNANCSASISAPPVASIPAVSLTANPNNVVSGGNSRLSWRTENVSICAASGGPSYWYTANVFQDIKGTNGLSDSEEVGPINGTTTFEISCWGPGGLVSDTAVVSTCTGACIINNNADPITTNCDAVDPGCASCPSSCTREDRPRIQTCLPSGEACGPSLGICGCSGEERDITNWIEVPAN